MNRRQAGQALLLGAVGATLPGAAFAQGMGRGMEMGGPERRHAIETLRVGGLALRTSRMAQQRARGPKVREFADFEVAEQTTIADIIRRSTGMGPPPPDPMAERTLARLDRLPNAGPVFEDEYVRVQTDGHQQLLAIQERYLAEGRDENMRNVAMLARGQIKEHLRLLADIRERRS